MTPISPPTSGASGGEVTVVLDSAQEAESDSVVWVRLEAVGG